MLICLHHTLEYSDMSKRMMSTLQAPIMSQIQAAFQHAFSSVISPPTLEEARRRKVRLMQLLRNMQRIMISILSKPL